jgi:hypothetical protein
MFTLQPHLDFLHETEPRRLSLSATTRSDFLQWQPTARFEIVRLLGIAGRVPVPVAAERLAAIDRGAYVEEKYALAAGEQVLTPMYVLVPKRELPFKPILVFHGHDVSAQSILGNFPDPVIAREQLAADNNYAQALAQAGYLVCAIEQRGLGERKTNQVSDETPPRSCRHLVFDYLLQGRTLIGERCWDGMYAINYLQTRTDVTPDILG